METITVPILQSLKFLGYFLLIFVTAFYNILRLKTPWTFLAVT